jgi:hypothetical protein
MIEIINHPSAPPRLAAIDFDGTMSLIRIGWQQVMHGVMHTALLPHYPDSARLDSEIYAYIARSTGQPSIIQMVWVDEQVILHGGAQPVAPKPISICSVMPCAIASTTKSPASTTTPVPML